MPNAPAPHARRLTNTLFAVQSLGSAGVIAAATVATIVGAELAGDARWAGAPGGAMQLGAAGAAFAVAALSDRLGRRLGLAAGTLLGALGAVVGAAAVALGSFGLLLVGLTAAGAGSAAIRLGRFAAAEVTQAGRRGRAVATVVLGGTVGSVLGPSLVAPAGRVAAGLELPELAGPYAATALLFGLAAVTLLLLLRPDPKALGEALAVHEEDGAPRGPARALREIARDPGVLLAVTAMVVSHGVMVMIMSITSLHMRLLQHELAGISIVFSAHTFGMYAVAVVTGQLTDRWGRRPVLAAGALLLVVSCLAAPLSGRLVPLMLALFGLGLGWNLSYVAGSALLTDRLAPAEKARVQGLNDLLMSLVAAAAAFGAGLAFAGVGYAGMGIGGAALAAGLLALLGWTSRRGAAAPATD